MKQASRILCSLFLVVCMTAGFLLPVAGASSAGQITVRDEVEVINSVRIGFDTAVISPGQTAAFPDTVRASTAGFVPTESETSIRYYQFPTSMSAMNPKAGCAGSILDLLHVDRFNHQVDTTYGILEQDCADMLTDFFRDLRERKKLEKSGNTEKEGLSLDK